MSCLSRLQALYLVVCVLVHCAVLTNSANSQTVAAESFPWRPSANASGEAQSDQSTPWPPEQRQSTSAYGESENNPILRLPPVLSGKGADPWMEADSTLRKPNMTIGTGTTDEYWEGPPLFVAPEFIDSRSPEPVESLAAPHSDQQRAPLGGGMMGMGGGGDRSPFRYRLTWQPAQPVQSQPTEMGLIQHDVGLMVPVWMSDPHMVMLSGSARADLFDSDAVFPNSGRPFPRELWNIRMGANYMRRFDNGWTGMVSVNVGSGSDQPFGDMRDVNLGVMAILRVPHQERNAWNFSLFYSPLSQIPFPIPMVAYQWQPSDEFTMNLGLPLQMTYRPTEQLTFDVSYMLLTTVHAQTTYQFNERWRVYSAFDWQNQSWFLHNRESDRERLFLYDKLLSVGVRTTVMKHVAVDLSTGYLFDRFYFTGENYNDQDHDRLDIGDGLFVSAQAGVKW